MSSVVGLIVFASLWLTMTGRMTPTVHAVEKGPEAPVGQLYLPFVSSVGGVLSNAPTATATESPPVTATATGTPGVTPTETPTATPTEAATPQPGNDVPAEVVATWFEGQLLPLEYYQEIELIRE